MIHTGCGGEVIKHSDGISSVYGEPSRPYAIYECKRCGNQPGANITYTEPPRLYTKEDIDLLHDSMKHLKGYKREINGVVQP